MNVLDSEAISKNNGPTDKISLQGIRGVISKNYFKPDLKMALIYLFVGITFFSLTQLLSYYIYVNKIYLAYPPVYFLVGTAVTSLFVLGHDCGHQSFFKSNIWNDILGHLFFIAPLYPYYSWKFSHNAHHKHTNKLGTNADDIYYDNAWIPMEKDEYLKLKSSHPIYAFLYKLSRTVPPVGSFLHNLITHFFPTKFNESQRSKVKFSIYFLGFVLLSFFSLSLYNGDIFAFFHFIVIPGIFFQFWMALYTFQHHTSTEMKFYNEEDWNPYRGQIHSTYNSLSPEWLSFLHFNIDIHTPHHLSTAIPSYYLRSAYSELKSSEYGSDIPEGKLSFPYLYSQIQNCHLWDSKTMSYVTFRDIEK